MYDLHTHSYFSDGQLSPEALVMLAKERGVTTLALTDHDNIDGIPEAQAASDNALSIIPGIEFSSVWEYGNIHQTMGIHIVGLNIDVKSPTLKEAITYQVNVREMRAQTIAERLEKKLDITGVLEGAAHCAQGNTIGRPHFAQYLVKRGYTSSVNEAFKKYLGAGKIGDVKQGWPSLETVVKWIIDSHGIAVLAHPTKYELTRNKMYQLMECFKNAGGQAVEVVSGKQDAKNTAILSKAADDFSFYASCGSDFHALGQPWQSLGEHTSMPENCKPVWQLF